MTLFNLSLIIFSFCFYLSSFYSFPIKPFSDRCISLFPFISFIFLNSHFLTCRSTIQLHFIFPLRVNWSFWFITSTNDNFILFLKVSFSIVNFNQSLICVISPVVKEIQFYLEAFLPSQQFLHFSSEFIEGIPPLTPEIIFLNRLNFA